MLQIHLLGTGAVVTDAHRTTTMLAFSEDGRLLLVDCGGDAVQRVQAAGLDLNAICGLFITHEHPDHVGGFPLFMEKIWLAGRTRPIDVYGIDPALDQARRAFATYDTSRWSLPEIRWHAIPQSEHATVVDDEQWRVTASPGVHGVPVAGIRLESRTTGAVAVYSSDTEPCETIESLARSADVLVHEATGSGPGHASAEEVADLARRAEAARVVLVHLPAGVRDADLESARAVHADIRYGEELDVIDVTKSR